MTGFTKNFTNHKHLAATILFVVSLPAHAITSDLPAEEPEFVYKRVFPYNIALTYNEKIGINAEINLYIPRTVKLSWPYIVNYSIMDGPFLSINAGYRAAGIGLGYGLFTRSLGTTGTNLAVKLLYSYGLSEHIVMHSYYLNTELESIVMFFCFEAGHLKRINSREETRNLFYFGCGIKL
ncbi:hypothetical protein JXL83_09125 [candidate division WOR-3 bacterium]|nr:hypothetical protein [candidate division WOR-3 bacterium]